MTAVTLALAVGVGTPAPTLAALVVAVVAGQLSVGWSNDWIDGRAGRDAGRGDKPVATGRVAPERLRTAALIALAVAVLGSVALGPAAAVAHLLAVALAWAYNLGLKSTPWSLVAYLGAFALLPVTVTLAADAGAPTWWAVTAAAAFGGGAHLANALPDIDHDRSQGIHGLPQRLGERAAAGVAVLLLAAGAVAALLGPPDLGPARVAGLVLAGATLVGVVAVTARDRPELAQRLTMACGLLVVGALVAAGGAITG